MGRHSWRGSDDTTPTKPIPLATSQTAYPWRTVVRTIIQVVAALAVAVPGILSASGVDQTAVWVAAALAASAAVTRAMADPRVNELLTKLGLGAEPKR